MKHSVLLDTSFFVRLLNDEDGLHQNAIGYYKYFLQNNIILKISTISIAEYCVRGKLEDLPLKNIQILPFNLKDAERAGEFAKIIFSENKINIDRLSPRAIIPNDAKLFAQSDLDDTISHFITSDIRSKNTFALLRNQTNPKFIITSIDIPYSQNIWSSRFLKTFVKTTKSTTLTVKKLIKGNMTMTAKFEELGRSL